MPPFIFYKIMNVGLKRDGLQLNIYASYSWDMAPNVGLQVSLDNT